MGYELRSVEYNDDCIDELEGTCKEVVVVYFNLLSPHLSGGKAQDTSDQLVSWSGIEPGTSRIQSDNHLTAMFYIYI
jgi:hypothetical protein